MQAARPVLRGPRPSNGPGLPDRALRPEVLLRKNCGGSGAPWAAEAAARAFSVIATAAQAQLNPLSYLNAYLAACATAGGKPPANIARFLPWSASPDDLATWRAPPPWPPPR